MREDLEEALNHRDDGYGRAQRAMKVELPKRFYKSVDVARLENGYTITLDGRQIKTPGLKVPVVLPTEALAQAIAVEWDGQGERIEPKTMPLVRLVNSALESGDALVPAFRTEIVKFAASDLLLYRTDAPQEFAKLQEDLWDDALVRVARRFEVKFQPTIGIIHQQQPISTLDRLGAVLEGEGLLVLTAMVSLTSLTGSGILTIGLRHGLFAPDEVWTLAHVDEDYQARLWGVDEEAALRRAKRRDEYDTALRLIDLVDGGGEG